MGYCPLCGHNSAIGVASQQSQRQQTRSLRLPLDSRIVQLDQPRNDDFIVSYGGSRFRVRRGTDHLVLEPID